MKGRACQKLLPITWMTGVGKSIFVGSGSANGTFCSGCGCRLRSTNWIGKEEFLAAVALFLCPLPLLSTKELADLVDTGSMGAIDKASDQFSNVS